MSQQGQSINGELCQHCTGKFDFTRHLFANWMYVFGKTYGLERVTRNLHSKFWSNSFGGVKVELRLQIFHNPGNVLVSSYSMTTIWMLSLALRFDNI